MKRFLLITLMAITAVAVVAAPVWAASARGRVLSDRQLDNVHAGSAVDDASNADAAAKARSAGDLFIAGAASSAAAATSSDIGSALAVKIENKCDADECQVKVNQENHNSAATGNNAQTILNTVASVNAVQINVASAGISNQSNKAYTAEGAVGEIDSFETGAAHAASAGVLGSFGQGTAFASADSSASSAASTSSSLAFATPRVEVKNRCDADECKLKLNDFSLNSANGTANNAQSILNTVASVNAVQINVAGGAATQSNIAFSTLK